MNWRVGDKMSMTASAGVEVTQLLGAELIDPIFSGTIAYRPWEQTSASLTASRSVSPSFYANEVLVSTAISAAFQQRFLKHFTFSLNGGYTTTPYIGFATVQEFNSHQSRRGRAHRHRAAEPGGLFPFHQGEFGQHFSQTGHGFHFLLI